MCTRATKDKLKAAVMAMADEAKAMDQSLELALADAFDELEIELKSRGRYVGRMVLMAPIPESE